MKKLLTFCLLLVLVARGHAAEVPARVHELAKAEFAALASDPAIIAAVAAQNGQHLTLEAIKELDQRWMATPGQADFMKPCLAGPAAEQLRTWRKHHAFVAEIILMDNQGANVAITEKTSDYWQGDEAKFKECAKDGGTVFIDKVKFDDSTQTYSVQVSVPIRDADGKFAGALCIGVDIEKL